MSKEDFSWVKAIVYETNVDAEQDCDGSWHGSGATTKVAFGSIEAAIDYADESNADGVYILDPDGNEIDPDKYYEEHYGK